MTDINTRPSGAVSHVYSTSVSLSFAMPRDIKLNARWHPGTCKASNKSHCRCCGIPSMDNHVPGPRRIHKFYHRPKSEKSECVIKYQLIFFYINVLKLKSASQLFYDWDKISIFMFITHLGVSVRFLCLYVCHHKICYGIDKPNLLMAVDYLPDTSRFYSKISPSMLLDCQYNNEDWLLVHKISVAKLMPCHFISELNWK